MKKIILLMVLCSVIGCNYSESYSNESKSGVIESSNSSNCFDNSSCLEENSKYVIGKRIFDLEYQNTPFPSDSFYLEDFSDIEFIRIEQSSFKIKPFQEEYSINQSLYLADVNQDGYNDICFGYHQGSGDVNYGVKIYDAHNDNVIFEAEERFVHDFLFDLDENNCLLLEDVKPQGGHTNLLNCAGRILKNSSNTISFEWYEFDHKLKGFNILMGSTASVGSEKWGYIYLFHIGTKDEFYPLEIDSILVTVNNDEFVYTISKSQDLKRPNGNPYFEVLFVFKKAGDIKITISIEGFAQETIIQVH